QPRQRGGGRPADHGAVGGEARSMARAREAFSLVVRYDAPQVRANRRDGVVALFFSKQKEIAGFDARSRTDSELTRVAQLEDTQRTGLHRGFRQAHDTGQSGSHGDHRAPDRSQSEKITAFGRIMHTSTPGGRGIAPW